MSPETDPQQVAAKVPPFAAFARVSPDFGLAALVGMLALGVYVRTLCPTIYLDDCGEIATAVATGGVMHPPGYPLYSLLGLLVSHVITAGEPAWRIGLISAVCGAGAVSAVYLLCRRVGLPALWAGLGALAFATSYTLWQQSTKVETYALNALLVSVLLNLAVRYVRLPTDKNFLSLAFFGGIALTNHLSIIWLIPALLWMTLATMATHRELWQVRQDCCYRVWGSVCCRLSSTDMRRLLQFEIGAARFGEIHRHPTGSICRLPERSITAI